MAPYPLGAKVGLDELLIVDEHPTRTTARVIDTPLKGASISTSKATGTVSLDYFQRILQNH
jgi:hypothetical protein